MRFLNEENFTHSQSECLGVLLTNLGTPDAPTAKAVRHYLAEFLADPRVVETPRWLWWPILHGFILRFRPRRVAHAYQAIWTEQGSPLLAISRNQSRLLQQILNARPQGSVKVALAMRYGSPSIQAGLRTLHQAGARRILVLPLYPQYSATTTASIFDAITDELKHWRWLPELRMVPHYHDHPIYIQALADQITAFWRQHSQPQRLMFSFHGLPRRYLLAGDPYFCECQKTARLVAESLQLEDEQWCVCFQSRFGREPWLQPYTDHTLEQLAKDGVKNVHLVCPGFAADCLETLEEINMQNRDIFLQAGGEQFEYIPALNTQPSHINMMVELVTQYTQDWQQPAVEADQRVRRAKALGAEQ